MLAPTLIVGLGGVGSDIVSRVERMTTPEQREHIAFCVFDTDVNELRALREKGYEGEFVQTSSRLTVGEYLNLNKNSKNWFPTNRILNRKTVSEGAGQIRAISRLAFNTTLRSGRIEPLHDAIDRLYKITGSSMSQAVRVIIVSSLAGGTGSGLILPLSLYIRKHLTSKYQQNASIVRGFFVLPEVFFSVIESEVERNNLRSNAYATMRELKAFLMKGDGTLSEQYKDLKFMMPKLGVEGEEDYDVMPFDFCFLFDAQNINGEKLDGSLESYKKHATQCIYAQSVSPMQSRSASSEDNVIRTLCKGGGGNRFCGAGSARLRYPFDDVRDYIAFLWAKQSISDDWTRIDREYDQVLKQVAVQKQHNVFIPTQKRSDHYIETVKSHASDSDSMRPFDKAISNACKQKDSQGFELADYKWDEYNKALKSFIKDKTEKQVAQTLKDCGTEKQKNNLSKLVGGTSESNRISREQVEQVYKSLLKFETKAMESTPMFATRIALEIFQLEHEDMGGDSGKQFLETWIKDENGDLIHPNAIRLFIYALIDVFKDEIYKAEHDLEKARERIEYFKNEAFDNPDTEDRIETFNDEKTKIKGAQDTKIFGITMNKDNAQSIGNKFQDFLDGTTAYIKAHTMKIVYKSAAAYNAKLVEAYELFFGALSSNVEVLESRTEGIHEKYVNKPGYTERYVCATPNCLDQMAADLTYKNSADGMPGGLRNEIHEAIKEYTKKYSNTLGQEENTKNKRRKQVATNYFSEVFEDSILGFWRETVVKTYPEKVDMNVLEALVQESEYENNCSTLRETDRYVSEVISEMNKLAQPFIECPTGQEPRIIPTSTFHPCLKDTIGIEKNTKENDIFKNGVSSEEIDKYQMIFYKAVYALLPTRLSKFSPSYDAETLKRDGGEYFKAYYDLVDQIDPDSKNTKVISPHLDKFWHIINRLPDLDEGNQKKIEKRIIKNFVYGLLYGNIYTTNSSTKGEGRIYCVSARNDQNEEKSWKLTTSNGTECDQFYEMLDAMVINPIILRAIETDVKESIIKEQNEKVPLDRSVLVQNLAEFKIPEFDNSVRSIFELPLLYEASSPVDVFTANPWPLFTDFILELLTDYIKVYVDAKDREYELKELVKQQWILMHKNIDKLSKVDSKYEFLKKSWNRQTIDKKLQAIVGVSIDDLMKK